MAKSSSSNGIGFGSLLFLLFLGLKLTNNIDWSWWWVTSPLWIPLGIMIVILGILGIISILANK
jgi:hypothetical protein